MTEWYLLECRGCEHVFAQTISSNSEDVDYSYGRGGETITDYLEVTKTWPAQTKRKRPDWMSGVGIHIEGTGPLGESLLELYGALDSELNTLAAIGMRTSFDIASELLGIDPNLSFQAKLKGLVDAGHIGSVDQTRLGALVDAGSASVHRGWKPGADDLNTMMDVLEQFIHDAFVTPALKKRLDAKVAMMNAFVPVRPTKQRTGRTRAPSLDSNPTPSIDSHITPELTQVAAADLPEIAK
ncbi:DUF4145 domain-containing protein [Mesorhizobium sp. M3A.F.Ca.ET.080.04.2.1]|uniref:DUF4145 domain-containing protein n=1 Tax=Mesorhizobium sp. M3A.F.Ca.ET.080.04.2.1 TaxID=2493676 RepID=UPI0013EA6AEF|nr:DUF4145 domain-containing protein [Mesorhizobium sp. M3A.F.Ca.ET.080.04.2.1]